MHLKPMVLHWKKMYKYKWKTTRNCRHTIWINPWLMNSFQFISSDVLVPGIVINLNKRLFFCLWNFSNEKKVAKKPTIKCHD